MKKDTLLNSTLYNNRHILSFFVVAFLLYFFIVFSYARFPIGLSQAEMDSAVLSAGISFPDSIINLPYHFFQWLSVSLLGLNTFALRLPSVLLALMTSGLIIATIRNFTRNNVAIITGLIMSCSVFFLNFARSGTPEIMSIFLMSLAIFAISQIVLEKSNRSLWLILLSVSIVLGMYMPGGVVFLLVLLVVALVNYKSRQTLTSLKPWQIIIAGVAGLAVLSPLVFSIVLKNDLLLTALGVDNFQFMPKDLLINLQAIFSPLGTEYSGYVTPLLSIGEIALAILGIVKLVRDGKSTRAAFILTISGVALIVSLFLPAMTFLMFIPWIFLIAFGVMFIIDYWYKLFPLNPYARVLGTIPIGILVFAMMLVGRNAFVGANYYDIRVTNSKNTAFEATREQINSLSAHDIKLVVPEDELEFYSLLENDYPLLKVTKEYSSKYETQILLKGTFDQTTKLPTKIVTGSSKTDSMLLKIYQK